jgi:beta-lactamase regulating signal transducer with metallopeptidase domain
MSQEFVMRVLFSGIFGLVFAWGVFSRYDTEVGSESVNGERQKYLPYIPSSLLPEFVLVIGVMAAYYLGIVGAVRLTLGVCFSIFLHISVYYIVLIPLLSFLRRYISARACAMLWVIPNYLYITSQSYMQLPAPKFVVYAPGKVAWILFGIWFVGFVIVLAWKTIEHLKFRRRVLRDSRKVDDVSTLTIWEEVIEEARIKKPKFKLASSSKVKTPLSVGLFRRSIRVILPEKNYSKEELKLILKHEIVHIAREDSWSKFFLVFCTAMCWFNPLMWYAMKKSAEDMELSCDETVLLNEDDSTRKKYAELLLSVAGDERGFTTCLSASAKTMRYRLKNIVKPRKRVSGALVVGLAFFLLCMTSGYVALAYGDMSGEERIYQNGDHSEYHVRSVTLAEDPYHRKYEIVDEKGFHEYLSGLSLSEITGNYSFNSFEIRVQYLMNTPKGTLAVTLSDNVIKITELYGGNPKTEHYYIRDGVDWEYLEEFIKEYPGLNMVFSRKGDSYLARCMMQSFILI